MKIKPDHYSHMFAAIKAISPEQVAATKAFIAEQGKAKDPAMRLRWDLSYMAGLTSWYCHTIYKYADDTHIDTALRRIMVECGYEK